MKKIKYKFKPNLLHKDRSYIISCSSEDLAKRTIKLLHKLGYKWCNNAGNDHTNWGISIKRASDVAYSLEKGLIAFADTKWYKTSKEYKNLPFINSEELLNIYEKDTL